MRIIVIGCGRVGAGLTQQLALGGHDLTVVDSDPAAFGRLPPGFQVTSLIGIGFDHAILVEAGIEHADALAAVTGSDEVNAAVARLAAVRFHVPRVVARMYDPRQADLYRRLGTMTISPVTWGIGRLAELLVAEDAATVFTLGGGQVDIAQVTVPPHLEGHPCAEIEIPGELKVGVIGRGSRTFIPDGNTRLHANDVVYVLVAGGAAERLEGLLGRAGG